MNSQAIRIAILINLPFYFYHIFTFGLYNRQTWDANQVCAGVDSHEDCRVEECFDDCQIPDWCFASDRCSAAVSHCKTQHGDLFDTGNECGLENGKLWEDSAFAIVLASCVSFALYIGLSMFVVCCGYTHVQTPFLVIFIFTSILNLMSAICMSICLLGFDRLDASIFSSFVLPLCCIGLIITLIHLIAFMCYCIQFCEFLKVDIMKTGTPMETEITSVHFDFEDSSEMFVPDDFAHTQYDLEQQYFGQHGESGHFGEQSADIDVLPPYKRAPPPTYESSVAPTDSWENLLEAMEFPDIVITAFRVNHYNDPSLWSEITNEELAELGVVKGLLLKFRRDYSLDV